MQTYEDFAEYELQWEDQEDWLLPKILEHQAHERPDEPFLQWETTDQVATFAETDCTVNCLAHGLRERGVEKGDHVLLMLPNSPEYVFLWFALSKIGAVEVPVNTSYKRDTLAHVANLTEADFGIFHDSFGQRILEIESSLNHLSDIVLLGDKPLRNTTDSSIEFGRYEGILTDDDSKPEADLSFNDTASIIMTSGTTGPSKAIQKTYAHQYFFAEQCVNITQLTSEDIYMTGNPLFHSNGQVLVIFPALIMGAKVALFEKFSASGWVDRLHETGATVCNFLGSMMDFVYQQPEREIDDNNDLRCLFAAPTAYGIKNEFEDRYGIEFTTEVIGTTETCMPVLTPYGVDRPNGAAGVLLSDYFDVQLVDPETDWPVETGTMGEYTIRPEIPWIMTPGYYGMPEKTVEALRNGWFHTGDGLRRDEDGWFYFVDRMGDTLRRRGENISTYEVEQPLLSHPAVEECAVVGIKAEEEGGEDEVKAWLTVKQGQSATEVELIEWANERMPYFMVPRYLEVVDELPKTENEKIQKAKLREWGNSEQTWDRKAVGVEVSRD
ncbi:AMP-binding protein [Halococcus sediminicola]|uniref:AMP-binding protein n=1 Tax=Halococcus sediminicola TaxID=1264579 RepID=UPI0006794DAE|nr:AMP-binding protein [Halococcus sediminicola]